MGLHCIELNIDWLEGAKVRKKTYKDGNLLWTSVLPSRRKLSLGVNQFTPIGSVLCQLWPFLECWGDSCAVKWLVSRMTIGILRAPKKDEDDWPKRYKMWIYKRFYSIFNLNHAPEKKLRFRNESMGGTSIYWLYLLTLRGVTGFHDFNNDN